eukprot:6451551-Pyramimonas_sp.AAC.1
MADDDPEVVRMSTRGLSHGAKGGRLVSQRRRGNHLSTTVRLLGERALLVREEECIDIVDVGMFLGLLLGCPPRRYRRVPFEISIKMRPGRGLGSSSIGAIKFSQLGA